MEKTSRFYLPPTLVEILTGTGVAKAGGQARRLIYMGAVAINGEPKTDAAEVFGGGIYEVRVGRKVTVMVEVIVE